MDHLSFLHASDFRDDCMACGCILHPQTELAVAVQNKLTASSDLVTHVLTACSFRSRVLYIMVLNLQFVCQLYCPAKWSTVEQLWLPNSDVHTIYYLRTVIAVKTDRSII